MKRRIYIDISVVGGYFDEEFEESTKLLFQQLVEGKFIFVISDILELELLPAPRKVKDLLYNYKAHNFEKIEMSKEAMDLADSYISENVVGSTSLVDCRHIALATLNKVDVLASWNFKHIVNLDRINGYNSVNLRFGYQLLEIRSPNELIYYGERSKEEK